MLQVATMVVKEEDVINIMGGMENTSGIKLNDHKRKLKNRFSSIINTFHIPYSMYLCGPCLTRFLGFF
jgi:hypothetical protein